MTEKHDRSNSDKRFGDMLNRVARLRLFRNSNREFGDYIGYKLNSNNSVKNIQPFTARCIFRELSRQIQEEIEEHLDLEDILDFYGKTSAFYEKHIKDRKKSDREETLVIILKYFYINDYQPDVQHEFLRNLLDKIFEKNINLPILLLLMLKILPAYTSKKGDVKDISADFKKLISFLREFVKCNDTIYNLPLLNRLEKEVQDGMYCNRVYLIHVANIVLETFRSYSNSKDLYTLNAGMKRVMPDIADAIWVEPDMLSLPGVFWVFEPAGTNNFFLYQYTVNTEKEQLVYTCYEANFLDGGRVAIAHPQFVRHIIRKEREPEGLQYFFRWIMDDNEFPEKIELKTLLSETALFPEKTFVRMTDDKLLKQLKAFLISYTKKNAFPETEYFFSIMPKAITPDYIYIKQLSEDNNEEPGYYRIPKSLEAGLAYIMIHDSTGVLTFDGRTYVGFESLMLYYDVTDEASRLSNGIEITDRIVL